MDPVAALRQIAYYKDRAREDSRRVMAYRNAADIVEGLDEAARERHGQANSWQSLPGIGPKTAKVIAQAWSGREPDALVELRSAAEDLGGGEIRAALRGDLHLHSNWSDGSADIGRPRACRLPPTGSSRSPRRSRLERKVYWARKTSSRQPSSTRSCRGARS